MNILIKDTNIEDLQLVLMIFSWHEIIRLSDHGDLIERDDAIAELGERIRANRYANAALVSELTRSIGYLMQLQAVIPAERSENEQHIN